MKTATSAGAAQQSSLLWQAAACREDERPTETSSEQQVISAETLAVFEWHPPVPRQRPGTILSSLLLRGAAALRAYYGPEQRTSAFPGLLGRDLRQKWVCQLAEALTVGRYIGDPIEPSDIILTNESGVLVLHDVEQLLGLHELPTIQGYVKKRKSSGLGWVTRYVIVTGCHLFWFSDENAAKSGVSACLGCLNFVIHQTSVDSEDDRSFKLRLPFSQRVIQMVPAQKDKGKWIITLLANTTFATHIRERCPGISWDLLEIEASHMVHREEIRHCGSSTAEDNSVASSKAAAACCRLQTHNSAPSTLHRMLSAASCRLGSRKCTAPFWRNTKRV